MSNCPVAHGPATLVIPSRRLRLVALPPLQDVAVGQICRVEARVESTDAADVTITFPEEVFEMVSPARTVRVAAGTAEVSWTLYARAPRPEPVAVRIRASAANLSQFAELHVRITAHADA
jgi:hypothetical protein